MEYLIRKMEVHEYPILEVFLYEAIYQRDEEHLLPRTIIKKPELQVYISDFGQMEDDYCLCAEAGQRIIGAVWVRIIAGFGSIDDETPEFAISILKAYRGYGIGTALMKQMLVSLKHKGYQKASLAVQKDNYALRMYLEVGFRIIDEKEEEYIMLYDFS